MLVPLNTDPCLQGQGRITPLLYGQPNGEEGVPDHSQITNVALGLIKSLCR